MATTAASVEAGIYLFSVIPIVLIVSVAILLDRATIYETLLHRCQIQIWLWLALLLLTSSSSMEWHDSLNNETTENSMKGFPPTMIYLTWAHLAIFFNLVGIILVEGRRISGRMPTVLRIVPLSCWWSIVAVVVVHAWTKFTSTAFLFLWKLSMETFLATLLGTWFLRILANRRVTTNLQGMPVTTTTTTAPPGGILARLCGMAPMAANTTTTTVDFQKRSTAAWLDERQWYTWTRIQTMQWFSQQLQGKDDETGRVLAILSKQCITGVVLDGLDLSQLVALKVPFGPACKLSNAIVGLLERYPKPRIINGVLQRNRNAQAVRASNDCLDLHDHEYNNTSTLEQQLQTSPPAMEEPPTGLNDGSQHMSQPPPGAPDGSHSERQQHVYPNEPGIPGGGGMSEEQHEKLNQVMKDRFGLELPKLRATDFLAVQKGLKNKAKMDQGPNDEMTHPFDSASSKNNYYANNGTPPTVPLPSRAPPSLSSMDSKTVSPLQSSAAGIPDHILKAMPSDVQEIAKRRPDLVATIWKQRQAQQQQRIPSKSNAAGLSDQRYNNNGLPALPERTGGEQNRADAMDEEFDSDNEDETTSLIHRDEIPGRYKAVDKSMYPSIL